MYTEECEKNELVSRVNQTKAYVRTDKLHPRSFYMYIWAFLFPSKTWYEAYGIYGVYTVLYEELTVWVLGGDGMVRGLTGGHIPYRRTPHSGTLLGHCQLAESY